MVDVYSAGAPEVRSKKGRGSIGEACSGCSAGRVRAGGAVDPLTKRCATSAVRCPRYRAARSSTPLGGSRPLLLVDDAPYGLPASHCTGAVYPGATAIAPQRYMLV